MKLLDFTGALNEEITKLLPANCNGIQQLIAGLSLGWLDFVVGAKATQYQEQMAQFGIVSADGDVNMDCIEHMLLKGVKWPVKLGPFKFDENDAKSIVQGLRARDGAK